MDRLASEGWWNSAPKSPLFWTARKIAFEIAVVGARAIEKLLADAVLETDILPVGVIPITAVPTAPHHAEEPLFCCFVLRSGEEEVRDRSPGRTCRLEQHNRRQNVVTRLVVALHRPGCAVGSIH